ncbi:MAG: hypothetical protein KIT16_19425 [Rhodospirillaceae bacterium]|nr:hypothetical protein [Rhodospirillaceae bacterium]
MIAGAARADGPNVSVREIGEPVSPDYASQLKRLSFAIFAVAAVLAIWAAAERRAFFADGAHFLLRLLEAEGFDLIEPSRRATMALMQAPAVFAIRSGLMNVEGITFVFCLTLELLPLLLLALTYAALPAARKHFFFFPLLHFLAGTLAASASPIVEAPIAAAYFWLLLCLVLFRRFVPFGMALLGLAALPAIAAHEVMAGLAPVLALAAAWRSLGEKGGWRRRAYALLALWFVVVGVVQAGFIVDPRSTANRSDLFDALAGMWWLIGRDFAVNFPAWMGLVAFVGLGLVSLRRARSVAVCGVVAACAVLTAAAVAVAIAFPQTVFPEQHFFARIYPAIVSLGLVASMAASVLHPTLVAQWAHRAGLAVVGVLAAGTLSWHAVEIADWGRYAQMLRETLARSRGVVAPATIVEKLDPTMRKIYRNMSWDWAMPSLSVMLAPQGRVSALVARSRPPGWRMWDYRDPAQLPRSRYLDLSAYRAALSETEGAPRRP